MATRKTVSAETKEVLSTLSKHLSPELLSEVQSQIGSGAELIADNQNQNQGDAEQFASLKPDVLREIVLGDISGGEEVMDNQNQNQGKLADLVKLKPGVLRQMRANLVSAGQEVMDNQNQNQNKSGVDEVQGKPPR